MPTIDQTPRHPEAILDAVALAQARYAGDQDGADSITRQASLGHLTHVAVVLADLLLLELHEHHGGHCEDHGHTGVQCCLDGWREHALAEEGAS